MTKWYQVQNITSDKPGELKESRYSLFIKTKGVHTLVADRIDKRGSIEKQVEFTVGPEECASIQGTGNYCSEERSKLEKFIHDRMEDLYYFFFATPSEFFECPASAIFKPIFQFGIILVFVVVIVHALLIL